MDQELLQGLLETAPDATLVVNRDGTIMMANTQAEVLFGYPSGDLVLQPLRILLPESIRSSHMQQFSRFVQSPVPHVMGYGRELFGLCRDDSVVPIEISMRMIHTGERCVVIVAIRDAGKRRAQVEAERRLRALAEALRDTSAVINATLDVGEVMERILDHLEQIVPYDAAEILLIEGEHAVVRQSRGYEQHGGEETMRTMSIPLTKHSNLKEMLETGKPIVIPDVDAYESWVYVPGTEWIEGHVGSPIKIDGEVIGFLTLVSKIPGFFTETHAGWLQAFADQAAIALKNARLYAAVLTQAEELAARNRELDAFSHTVAHDLKSPLASVVGYIGILSDLEGHLLSDEGRAILKQAEVSAYHMKQIIESLLLLSQLLSAEQEVTSVDMRSVIESALERTQMDVASRGVTVKVGDDLPPVMGYGPWLEEVLANLITNAVKYTGRSNPQPTIHIYTERVDRMVRYMVEDNGMGIAPVHHKRLFEMFARFHSEYAEGLGLGLSIVQRIIRKLDGELGLESEVGKGSCFWFGLREAENT